MVRQHVVAYVVQDNLPELGLRAGDRVLMDARTMRTELIRELPTNAGRLLGLLADGALTESPLPPGAVVRLLPAATPAAPPRVLALPSASARASEVARASPTSSDVARLAFDPLGTRPPRIKVQVKRQQAKVDVHGLRSFMAVLAADDLGIFVNAGASPRTPRTRPARSTPGG